MGQRTGKSDHIADARDTERRPLVGRERELELLSHQLEQTLTGHGRLVLISGEAGIGKTALVDEVAHGSRQRGALVFQGGCYDLTITPSYGPWMDAIDSHQRSGDGLDLVRGLQNFPLVAGATSQEFFEQFRAKLSQLTAHQPVVLILEDLQWADSASLDLLRFLARGLDDLALLLIVTWRDDEAPSLVSRQLPPLIRETHPLRIALRRLTRDELGTLVSNRYHLVESAGDALADLVQRRTDGNPFLAEEVLLSLEQQGALRAGNDTWSFTQPDDFGVPAVVRQVIEQRLDRLSQPTLRVLEYGAIAGQDATLDFLQTATGLTYDEFDASLHEATANHIIDDTSATDVTLRFRHALVRETLYARQNAFRRRARHGRVAQLLLDQPVRSATRLAYHFQAARDPRSVEWLVRAGEVSLEVHAPHDAIMHLIHAKESAQQFGIELSKDAVRLRGRAWEMVGNFENARDDYDLTLRLARADGDRSFEWQALLDLGVLWAERDYDRGGEALHESLALARQELSDIEVARSLNAVGNWHLNHEEPHPAIGYHQQALAIFTNHHDQHGVAASLDLLALAQYVAGDVRQAARQFEHAVELLEALDDQQLLSSALANWAMAGGYFESDAVAIAEGTLQYWLAISARARSMAQEIGWAAGQAYAEIQAGAMIASRGEMDQAMVLVDEGMHLAERIGHRQWMVCGHVALGRLHADLQEFDRAQIHLKAALDGARAIASPLWINFSTAALTLLLIDIDELDTASAFIEPVLSDARPATSTTQRLCRMAWARLLTARGEPQRAVFIVNELFDTAPSASGARSIPWLALTRGQAFAALGELGRAEADLTAARLGALPAGYRHLLVRIGLALGQLLHESGRTSEACSLFAEAENVVNQIAATLPSEKQRLAFLSAMRKKLPHAAGITPDRAMPVGLSPREIEVLRLVASGLTDVETGTQLAISRRTVGRHLESIYGKLGVGSRTAAAAFAYEHGLVLRTPPD